MPEDVEIRIARDDELERVVRLRWLWTTERGGAAGADERSFVEGAAAWARAHRETHVPHVAVDPDGSIVGMAWLALTPRVASTHSLDRWSGDLQSCYVLPGRRDAGIGGRLVEAVLATARARGAEHVTVHTSADSVRMYARHGFAPNARLLWADSSITER
ncbi:GNAT family N-acetyltransferase [Microbacterium sp. NPDC058389]|uniref:GNAT family N-acetyltransferase n=1 Tax=Microbacterium sp. NPDC058389 TaxID=3346475 RepID=UPI0036520732